jgi:phosphoglycolate phosphatase-like HAD superfamily hydrolase
MQNIIAVIWDFDKTLVDGYMQDPIFQDFEIDSSEFWKVVNALPNKYKEKGVKVNPDTIYLNQFIKEANGGKFPGLSNTMLRDYGEKQKFYNGIPEIFEKTLNLLSNDEICQ